MAKKGMLGSEIDKILFHQEDNGDVLTRMKIVGLGKIDDNEVEEPSL